MTPDQYTSKEYMLPVGNGHQLYVHEWGNPGATTTIIHLHGGPGSGSSDSHKTLFDPSRQRVVFFDQRGCGKSLPYGSLQHNTTDELVEDISRVADSLKLKTFVLTGGSWGSCLALVYAIRYPARVSRMVIRGIFTGRQSEIDFIDKGGVQMYFPDVWEQFVQSVPKKHRGNPSAYHLPRVLGADPVDAKQSAYAYDQLESSVLRLDDRRASEDFETYDPGSITIECYYMHNHCFLPEGFIMEHANQLTMPIAIVQGRYDTVCPALTAYELHQLLPNSSLTWTIAGHSGSDRANWDAVKLLLN
jgi:proline iminopeptidase